MAIDLTFNIGHVLSVIGVVFLFLGFHRERGRDRRERQKEHNENVEKLLKLNIQIEQLKAFHLEQKERERQVYEDLTEHEKEESLRLDHLDTCIDTTKRALSELSASVSAIAATNRETSELLKTVLTNFLANATIMSRPPLK